MLGPSVPLAATEWAPLLGEANLLAYLVCVPLLSLLLLGGCRRWVGVLLLS